KTGGVIMAENNCGQGCKTYLRIVANERFLDDIAGCIAQFAPCRRDVNGLVAGFNDSFDIDVNVMIRETLKGFFGREQFLLNLQNKYSAEIWLEVVPQIAADSEQPRQMLSIDEDIIEFLYKAKVRYDLDYYVY
ncbi:MAG: hypothetical protein ACI4MC_01770, partial [Candidatus Coproplasma sp.]